MLYGATPLGPEDDGKPAKKDEDVVREAAERWNACKDWQGSEDERAREDIKFANGDARNLWQWPQKPYQARDGSNLPCLTINNTRVHNDLIINEMSKTAFAPKARPVGGKASYKSADLMQKLILRTLDISKYPLHRRKVAEQQVDGGIGYILIETDYVSERSFDQDIYLKASRDPTGVYLDPWIREPDGSDANFGFVFERIPRKEFNRKYPQYKDMVGSAPLTGMMGEWLSDKEIMLCKYYRKSNVPDTLVSYKTDDGDEVEKLSSEIREEAGKDILKALLKDIKSGTIDGKTRKVFNPQVEWFLIAGDKVVDKGDWAGKYIPICRCVGREVVIDHSLDRKGHTRPLINAQHMLNYNASVAVQMAALGSKAQWHAPADATEGQESWATSNVSTFPVLTWNHKDDDGNDIPAPVRVDPPQVPAASVQGMESAERQMMMISGQFQAQMGENDTQSAASGKAINERQQQGDTATWHFVQHMTDMERFIGVQLLDLYPRIYDTQRVLHIAGEDGGKFFLSIDPNQDDAITEMQREQETEAATALAFNPKIGEYEVISDPGPDYATQRQEAWNAYSMILQQNMQLAAVIGDLIFQYGDFPGAEDIAERLKKEIQATKPYLFSDKANPALLAATEQTQKLQALNGELMQKLALKEIALKGKDERRDIEAFRAETDRMKAQIDALAKIALTPQQRAQMEHELMMANRDDVFTMIHKANEAEIDSQAQAADHAHDGDMADMAAKQAKQTASAAQ